MSVQLASPLKMHPRSPSSSPHNDENAHSLPQQSRRTGRSSTPTADRIGEFRRSASRSPTKMPTLSDIAARMKLDRDTLNQDGLSLSPGKASSLEGRPRLGMTGRLSSPSKKLDPSVPVLGPSSPSKLNLSNPDGLGSTTASGSSSPTKRMTAKGIPSLDEVRERMIKKGLAISSPDPAISSPKPNQAAEMAEQSQPSTPFLPAPPATETPVSPRSAPADKDTSPNGHLIKDSSIMRLGTTKPHTASVSPLRLGANVDSIRPLQDRVKAGLASLPPTPISSSLPIPPKPSVHPLQHQWTLYFDSKSFNPNMLNVSVPDSAGLQPPVSPLGPQPSTPTTSSASWEANLKSLGAYKSIESFFGTFATLRRPSQLEKSSSYHIFKDGIKPMWEDPKNAQGGKWVLTLRQSNPALLDRSWMWLVLGLIGEELDEDDQVTGAVCSLRQRGDKIALWLRSKDDVEKVNALGRKLVQLLELEKEPGINMEFSYNTGQPVEQPSRFLSIQNPVAQGFGGHQQSFGKGVNTGPFQRHGLPPRSSQPPPPPPKSENISPGRNRDAADGARNGRGTSSGTLGMSLGVTTQNRPVGAGPRSPVGGRFGTLSGTTTNSATPTNIFNRNS